MRQFIIIGINDGREPFFPPEILQIIGQNHIFSGGKRHHEIMLPFLPESSQWIDITVPLDRTFEAYQGITGTIVVFASGDPLFYGFATTVMNRCPDAAVKVYPAFNSLQQLAHRLNMPYHNLHVVSLTGRDWPAFDEALIRGEVLIGVLTDRVHTPAAIAQRMLEYGYSNYEMYIGELLGNEKEERIRLLPIADAARLEDILFPNCLLLRQTFRRQQWFGIPDSEFHLLNGRSKMITKMPIRLADLSVLDLANKTSLWDIGFCTGSVSIEAKLHFPHLKITSFEIRPEGEELMARNARKFGTPGITTVIGDFMKESLEQYPAPDAVFIGGHGGELVSMIALVKHYLKPGGEILFNSVSEESLRMFEDGISKAGMSIIATHRIAVDMFNPILIYKAK